MKTININPLHELFTPELKEGFENGYTVVTSQRPLNGLKTWENDSIGYGRYYAYGSLQQFESVWNFLDAAIVKIITNEDIEKIISNYCNEEGIELTEVLMDSTMSELAESFDLCYID